jgi:phage terminase large subunit-like protein
MNTPIKDSKGTPKTKEEMKWAIENNYIIPAFKDGEITVDKLLDHADVRLEWYSPSEQAFEFINFIRLSLGEEPENTNPPAHYFLMDCIFKSPEVKPYFQVRNIDFDTLNRRVAVLCTRDFAKALHVKEEIITPNGLRTIGSLKVGDVIYDRNFKETKVTAKSEIFNNSTFKLFTVDNRTITLNKDHLNIVLIDGKEKVLNTYDLFKLMKRTTKSIYIPIAKMENRKDNIWKYSHLNPYLLGETLGYMISTNHTFTQVFDFAHESLSNNSTVRKRQIAMYEKIYNSRIIPNDISFESYDFLRKTIKAMMDVATIVDDDEFKFIISGAIRPKNRLKSAKALCNMLHMIGAHSAAYKYRIDDICEVAFRLNEALTTNTLIRIKANGKKATSFKGDYIEIKEIKRTKIKSTQCIQVDSKTKSFVLKNGLVTHNSTLIGSFLNLYLAAKGELPNFGKVNFMIYVSDSMENNVKTTMQTIGGVYRESLYLKDLFEETSLNMDRVKFVRKPMSKKELALYQQYAEQGIPQKEIPGRMKRTYELRGIGAQSGARGTRSNLSRPNGAIIDDVVKSEKDATSDVILDAINSTIDADVLPALSGTGNFAVLIGTPYNKKDPVYSRIESGTWLPIVFPRAEEIRLDLKKEEFRGVWEDKHTYENCMLDFKHALMLKDKGDASQYRRLMQEFYLRISSEEDKLIPKVWWQYFKREDVLRNAHVYNWYITTDFTTTGATGSDYSAMMLWALGHEGDFMLVDLVVRKMDLEEQYLTLFDMVRGIYTRVNHLEVGVETDGQQKAHIFALKQMMPKQGIYFSFARQKGAKVGSEGISSRKEGGNKHWRFRMMVPYFQNRKIWFAEELKETRELDWKEFSTELEYVNTTGFGTKHDDALDCVSMLNAMETVIPTKQEMVRTSSDGFNYYDFEEDINDEDSAYDSYA